MNASTDAIYAGKGLGEVFSPPTSAQRRASSFYGAERTEESQTEQTQGGILCNTPPCHDFSAMKRIYSNFDGLDISFQGYFPADEIEKLKWAKEDAQKQNGDAVAYLGASQKPVLVRKTGVSPYAYVFDTGPDGATWMAKRTEDPTEWGIRVSVHSLALALYGYEGVKTRIKAFLIDLGAFGGLLERISRVDFCVDFITDHFTPNPKNFICHSRSTKRGIGQIETVDLQTVERGGEYESVMIGKMPGKQVVLYNKSREVQVKNKPYWWKFWGLDQKTFTGQVWRVEIRAGKHEIDKWPAKRFDDFESKIGDIFGKLLDSTRYVVPTSDSNVTRWPESNLWKQVRIAVKEGLDSYSSGVEPEVIKQVLRYEVQERYASQIISLIPGLAVALGMEANERGAVMLFIHDYFNAFAEDQPNVLEEKFRRAVERLVFFEDDKQIVVNPI
ncbi:MAG: hypothetical protein HQL68_12410 [Magnetococcales bacterium]|nr:hypothetical protein [Magnetococcales bacterium]